MSSSSRAKASSSSSKLYSKLASKILNESLRLKKGESITIETWNNGQDFAQKVVTEARKIGTIPLVVLEDEDAYVQGAKTMDREILGKMGKHEYGMLSGSDAYIFIPGRPLSAFYTGLSGEERSASTAYNASWYEAAEKAKLRGVRLSFGHVGKEMSKVLGKAPDKIISHQLKAALDADFYSISEKGKQIAQTLQDGASCAVTSSDGSKLEFQLRGDTEVQDGIIDEADVADGYNMAYMPPGFVSKQVDSSTVSGKLKVLSTGTSFGAIKDATVEFESGKLVRWESKPSQKVLDKIVQSINEDSRKLGMVVIGLNPYAKLGYGIDRFVSGAISLNITMRLSLTVQKGSLSVNGNEIVNSGKLSISSTD